VYQISGSLKGDEPDLVLPVLLIILAEIMKYYTDIRVIQNATYRTLTLPFNGKVTDHLHVHVLNVEADHSHVE
jgi:hypothetical protein